MKAEAVVDLISGVAGAGLHPERWPKVLAALADASGSRGVAILPLQAGGRLQHTPSLDALAERYIEGGWVARDYRARGLPKMMAGQVAVDGDFIAYDDLRREPYYTSFLAPLGFRHFAGFATGSGDETWAVTFQRTLHAEAFSVDEQAVLGRLIRPFAEAVTIGREIGEAYHRGALDQIGRAGTGCILIDRHGRAANLNAVAETMVGHVLDLRQGAIVLKDERTTRMLQSRIRAALRSLPIDKAPLVAVCAGSAHLLEVVSLPDLDSDAFSRFRCMVLIRDLLRPVSLDPDLLRSVFDLTPRECRLADALCRASGLVEAAAGLGIGHETARTQLKSIFAKTGTASQTQLVALLGRLGG